MSEALYFKCEFRIWLPNNRMRNNSMVKIILDGLTLPNYFKFAVFFSGSSKKKLMVVFVDQLVSFATKTIEVKNHRLKKLIHWFDPSIS
jgi:hypothetical protein